MTTPVEPYGDGDRTLMWTILGVWAKSTSSRNSPVERDIRTEFPPLMHAMFGQQVRRLAHPVHLHTKGWLVGEELTRQPGTIPVVTFEAFGTHAKVEEAAFRVALMSLIDGKMHAEGWRFEQAELPGDGGKIATHPYAHAQAIIGWRKDVHCLIHRPHNDGETCEGINDVGDPVVHRERIRAQQGTLVKHPAFPIGVKSLSGLALAVFSTLYGAPKARESFGSIRGIKASGGDLREDFLRLCIL